MRELKQSTQIVVRIGPFVDVADGATPETTVALATADQTELLKANGAATVDISAATWTAVTGADGWYDLTLTAADTDTLGQLAVVVQDVSLSLPVFAYFEVVQTAYYDAKYGTGALKANVTEIGGVAQSATDLKHFADTGYDPATGKVEAVKVNDDMRGTDGAILSANSPANFADLAITATTGLVTVGTNNDKSGYSLTQAFPTNFGSLVITPGGAVDTLVQGYLNTLITETTAGRIAGNFDTFFENANVATAKTVDDVGGAGGGGGTDWTTTERSQIRYRLGVDGATAVPATNTPNLGDMGITQGGADKVWNTVTRTITDKAGFSIAGTKTTLDALNDIDGSSVTAVNMRGTDNALLAASAPVNFGDLSVTATTGEVTVGANNDKAGYNIAGTKTTLDALNDIAATDIFTAQMTEAYAADGTAPTLAEMQFMLWSALSDFSVSGTSIATRKLDGATTAMTFTLDDNTNPTSRTRSL